MFIVLSFDIFWESHPHGCVSWNVNKEKWVDRQGVTPSRVCELKSFKFSFLLMSVGHTLTGVWVEIWICYSESFSKRHTLTGVWVEIGGHRKDIDEQFGHTLTGVWVEIPHRPCMCRCVTVTPSRVCELKLPTKVCNSSLLGHTLTGVWVEIIAFGSSLSAIIVTPSRVCELKSLAFQVFINVLCHTLTGVWVEI